MNGEDTISGMESRYASDREMLVIEARGPMPDGLVALCRMWGIIDDE